MKFSCFGFFLQAIFISLLMANNGNAQQKQLSVKEVYVRVSLKNATLSDVFTSIEKQTSFVFNYDDRIIINNLSSININGKRSVADILLHVSELANVKFKQVNNNISVENLRDKDDQENKLEIIIQTRNITGKVTSTEDSEGLPGVNVVEKGTLNGTVTDIQGNFSLQVTEGSSLIFSSVGYATEEMAVGNRSVIDLVMIVDIQQLQELIVVGYGEQKKANLTGAVSTASSDVFENRAVSTAAEALQGKLANLNIVNSDGGPGKKPRLNIRGYAGLGVSYSPLVIVDGVTSSIDHINPNDIETVTVLKDAAASAVYGAQAAYGVILITTKNGKKNEKPIVAYSTNFSWNEPTVLPQNAGSLEFAKLFREASINSGGGGVIDLETMERIEKYYYNPGSIPTNVPQVANPQQWSDWGDGRPNANEDWFKAMFKKQMNQMHNISIKGGSESSTYMMSLGYLGDNGKLRYYDDHYNRINATGRLNTDVYSWLNVGFNFRLANEKVNTPMYHAEPNSEVNNLIGWTARLWPTIPVRNPNGALTPAGRMYMLDQGQPNLTFSNNSQMTGYLLFKLLPGLTANFDFSYNNFTSRQTRSLGLLYDLYADTNEPYLRNSSPETTQVWQASRNNDMISSNAYATYEKAFNGHSFKLMGGTQVEFSKSYALFANKRGLILPDQPAISTAIGVLEANDAMDHWSTLGFFSRFNYDFNNKYLVEFVVRHDGSSRYPDKSISPTASKWGTFPSLSAGWNIAEESFFSSLNSYVSQFKLRGSWGELGNMRGKSYQYISTIPYNPTYGYIMDTERIGAFGSPSMIAYNTWETSRTLNFGVDLATLKNRLMGSFDIYQRDIIDLITKGETLPAVLGEASPVTNNANIRNNGWELSLDWKDRFNLRDKPFVYGVYFNLSDYQGVVTKYSNPKGLISDWYVGKKMGEIWGYTTSHIMIDPAEAAEVNASKSQAKFGSNWSQGDIRYRDLDGSGVIDNGSATLDDHGDWSIIGNNTPRYNFSFGLNSEWNGFDITAFFQGVGKRDIWLSGVLANGIGSGQWSSNVWKNTLNTWRNDESNMNPYWPKLYLNNTSKNLQVQTRYLDDASFLRLKNLQIGYTIPSSLSQKASLEKVRIYFSSENLLTFSKINENFDPEVTTVNNYPLSKSVSIGLNVSF